MVTTYDEVNGTLEFKAEDDTDLRVIGLLATLECERLPNGVIMFRTAQLENKSMPPSEIERLKFKLIKEIINQ